MTANRLACLLSSFHTGLQHSLPMPAAFEDLAASLRAASLSAAKASAAAAKGSGKRSRVPEQSGFTPEPQLMKLGAQNQSQLEPIGSPMFQLD